MRLTLMILALATFAHADEPGCFFTVHPSVNLATDGEPELAFRGPKLRAHWQINSEGACAPNWYNSEVVNLVYAATGEYAVQQDPVGCEQQQGGNTDYDLVHGVKITPEMWAFSGDPLQNSGWVQTGGSVMIVPPTVAVVVRVYQAGLADADGLTLKSSDPSQIPVGARFHVVADLVAHPVADEKLTLHIEGAGIHFARQYGATYTANGTYQNPEVPYLGDETAGVMATEPGAIQYWWDFEGAASPVVTLTAVANANSSTGGTTSGGSSGGTSGGTSGGVGQVPAPGMGGCDVGGHGEVGFASLLLVAFALSVRAASRRRS